LVIACQSGEAEAFQRIIDHFYIRRPMVWDRPPVPVRVSRLRHFVWNRLATAPNKGDAPDLLDARLLIARSYGFENWSQLEAQTNQNSG